MPHKFLFIPFIATLLFFSGCASKDYSVETVGQPVVFLESLDSKVKELFPLSDWQQTKTTLYDPEVEFSEETGGIWVRVKGQTWNWDERRYRYSVAMLTIPEIDTDTKTVRLPPSREIIWHLEDVPRLYKQQVMDMTYPIIIDTFHDRGFDDVRFERRPVYHE